MSIRFTTDFQIYPLRLAGPRNTFRFQWLFFKVVIGS